MKKQIIILIILSLMAVSLIAPTVTEAKLVDETRVIVGFKDFPSEGLIRANGWKVNHEYKTIPAVACSLSTFAIEILKKSPFVSYIEEDTMVALSEPDAELLAAWGVMKIGADTVQATGNQGEGIKVAVIDTGINYLHEDLQANYKGGYDFVNKDADPFDDNGHGTHCAGVIAAADNDIAVVGVAPKASLYALKVLNSAGNGYTSDIIAAIQWATTTIKMDVISLSLGSSVGSTAMQQACDAAFNSGIVVVAAAGNNGAARTGTNILYPARYPNVIAVGATNQNNVRASFSNTGPELDLMAPGVSILSDYIDVSAYDYPRNLDTLYMSGTSMATPHVAGTAALILKSYEPGWQTLHYTDGNNIWSAQEVTNVLIATADDLGATGKDNYYGYGIVDADQAALPPNTPPPTPSVVVSNVGITAPSDSSGGTVVPNEVFTVTAQIRLNTGSSSRSVTATLSASGYTIAIPDVTNLVGTENVPFVWTVKAPSYAADSSQISVTAASATPYVSDTESFSVTTVAAAALTGSFMAPDTSEVNQGATITVKLKVDNTGTASAIAVTPATLTFGDANKGTATKVTGPTPASAAILGGGYQEFTWTYTATSVGTVSFYGSAKGIAQYSGDSVETGSVGPSDTVTIITPPPTLETTLPPTLLSITTGTLGSGTVSNLNSNDGSYLTVKSARLSVFSQALDWNTKTSIASIAPPVDPSEVTSITITYDGKYSTSQVNQKLYIYDYTTAKWTQIDSRTVSTQDTKITWSTIIPTNFISAAGDISLRVYATKSTNNQFTCYADHTAFTVKYTV
jgi:subtilisin